MTADQTVRTEVTQEQGQWVVHLLVIDGEGVSRRRLSAHRSRREAEVTASSIQRGAHRRQAPLTDEPPIKRPRAEDD